MRYLLFILLTGLGWSAPVQIFLANGTTVISDTERIGPKGIVCISATGQEYFIRREDILVLKFPVVRHVPFVQGNVYQRNPNLVAPHEIPAKAKQK